MFRLQEKPVVIKIFEILCFMICTFRFRMDPEPPTSAVEPDPNWIRIQWGPWIWIRIQEDKSDPQTQKKVNKFHFLEKVDKFIFMTCWMFSFGGLKASPVAWTKKYI